MEVWIMKNIISMMIYELCDFNIYCRDPHYLAMTEWDMTTAGRDQIQRLKLVAPPKLLLPHVF